MMLKQNKIRLGFVAAIIVIALIVVFPIGNRLHLGLDLKGGVHIVLQAKGTAENPVNNESIERLLAILRNRIDQYGIAEPVLQREGADRVAIDLPGMDDPAAALELIGKTAVLEFREVLGEAQKTPEAPKREEYGTDAEYAAAMNRYSILKADAEAEQKKLQGSVTNKGNLMVAKDASGGAKLLGPVLVSGADLTEAATTYDQFGKASVSLKFNSLGARLFDKATAENIGKQIAIVLDGTVISAPVVQQRISGGSAQITGNFSTEEAGRLAIMLKAGALPLNVEVLENRSVGPTLGQDSIQSGITSGLWGAGLVFLFMLVFYGLLGVAADIALAVAILLILAAIILLGSTLTLPGIGGLILTIGMAVDGNVLIYERVKEELRAGMTKNAALDAGFKKALTVILDSNITTLIAAAILFYFGSGPVRGFAVTLSVGVIASVFCNIVVTRAVLTLLMSKSNKFGK